MGDITAPRLERSVRVRHGRRLGVAEFGPPDGQGLFWLHGTPGARRQIPEEARQLADARGLRVIGIDRPGVGLSPPHQYESVADFVPDLELVADQLGVERFSTVGLSGGGPYAMAAAARLPDRVVSVGVLGGVVPTVGPDAVSGGLVGVAHQLRHLLPVVEVPAGFALQTFVRLARPLGSQVLDLYARVSPPGDREVLRRAEIKAVFLDDIGENGSRGLRSVVHDSILFTRQWGFTAGDIAVPLTWWHGDADHIVPLAHAEHLVARIPGATLHVRPGESHLGGMGIAEEVVSTVMRW
jgi:pimeloyl-ACP methyl ester carboxylesterase